MQQFASQNNWLKYIDVTKGLYDPTGYIKREYTNDGLHLNAEGNKILLNNIKVEIIG